MQNLTERQQEVGDYIKSFTERRGRAPKLGEIGRALGIANNTAWYLRKAFIKRSGKCPTCSRSY